MKHNNTSWLDKYSLLLTNYVYSKLFLTQVDPDIIMSVFTKLSKSLASFLQTLQQKHPQKVGFSFELYFIENIQFGQSQMKS